MGDFDLRGLSRAESMHATAPLLSGGRPFTVEIERNGTRLEMTIAPATDPYWWSLPLPFVPLALVAIFLLLRAPHWHLARRFFAGSMAWCVFRVADLGLTNPAITWVWVVAGPLTQGLLLWNLFEWTEAARPLRTWQRFLPWVIALVAVASGTASMLLTLPMGLWPFRISMVNVICFFAAATVGLARAYRRSGALERRQLRWVLYGLSVAGLPLALLYVVVVLGIDTNWLLWDGVAGAFVVAIPLGMAVSVVGYRYLDIDRVIGATASYTILGIAIFGGVLVAVPSLASMVSGASGIDPETSRIALSLTFAAGLVLAHSTLRPWIDRRLLPQHDALARAFERLLAELSACRGVEELARRAGEGIDALLRPDSIATYARAGEAFMPLFVRGHAAPPAFEAKSALVNVLETRGTPIAARSKELGPFERAALEALGAEIVMPVRQREALVAFTCLATKRSGDIYTATDQALLAAVAGCCTEVLSRLDANAIAEEARGMQTALRRYVPGAVANQLLDGAALQPSEQEVTILFVDLRGYTRYAEDRHVADVFATLNEHTERVSTIVQHAGGTIVEFNGDGMMAVFGAPEALAEKERHAVEAARRIVDSMPMPLAVGVGIATGTAFVGSIRSSDRMIWTAVGSTTNLASRLQALTRDLAASVAIDEITRTRAGYVCADFVHHADIAIRGRTGRFEIFALPLRDGEHSIRPDNSAAHVED
jgi:class 3 adenylate cyclase